KRRMATSSFTGLRVGKVAASERGAACPSVQEGGKCGAARARGEVPDFVSAHRAAGTAPGLVNREPESAFVFQPQPAPHPRRGMRSRKSQTVGTGCRLGAAVPACLSRRTHGDKNYPA